MEIKPNRSNPNLVSVSVQTTEDERLIDQTCAHSVGIMTFSPETPYSQLLVQMRAELQPLPFKIGVSRQFLGRMACVAMLADTEEGFGQARTILEYFESQKPEINQVH